MKQSFHFRKGKEDLEKLTKANTIYNYSIKLFFSLCFLVFVQQVYGQGLGLGRKKGAYGNTISYANPQEYEIAEIKVIGLKTLNENALVSLSGLKVGDKIRIPGEQTSNAIKKLWKNGIIGNVEIRVSKIENDKAYLIIELTERPRLTRIYLEGVSKSQETEISEDLDLIRGRVISESLIKSAENTAKKFFVEKGYLKPDIKVIREPDSIITNGQKLRMVIDKRSKIRINEIYFEGNNSFSDAKLKSKLKKTGTKVKLNILKDAFYFATHPKPKKVYEFFAYSHDVSEQDARDYFSRKFNLNFFKTPKLVRSQYKDDKKNVIKFYNSKGYRDARIVSDSIYYINDNEINIQVNMDEGRKYYFRDIKWTGNYLYSDELLASVLGIQKGDVYDMDLIQKKLQFNPNGQDVSSLYLDYGYLFFTIDPVEVRIEEDSIDVEMRIFEGEQAIIDRLIITGNDRTNDHVIMRQMRTLPGDKFSRSNLIRTQRELSQLGYFDPEKMEIVPMPNPSKGTVDIKYGLVEKPNDQVNLSGGWGGYYGFIGSAGITFNNFSLRNLTKTEYWRPLPIGDGQRLSLMVQASGKLYQNYSFTFTEPWLGGKKPNSFTVGVSHAVQRTSSASLISNDGTFQLTNFSVGLGKRLKWPDDYFMLQNTLSYTYYKFNNFHSNDNIQLGFDTGSSNNVMYTASISRNSIDQPMFPREGSSLSLSLSLTPPYSLFNHKDYNNLEPEQKYKWVEYHKWMFDFSYFQKLAKKLVINTRAHLGFMGTYSNRLDTGPFDRFQLGGSGLSGQNSFILGYDIIGLRGYQDYSITPPRFLGAPTTDQIRGGTAYNKYVMEMRYAISTEQVATIYVLGFVEAGNNFYTLEEFNPFKLYRSAGVGARIFMPAFGLLGVDWGYGFDRVPGSPNISGPQFHFSIGQQFR